MLRIYLTKFSHMNNTLSVLQNYTHTNNSVKNITISNLVSNITNISYSINNIQTNSTNNLPFNNTDYLSFNNTDYLLNNDTNYLFNNNTNSTKNYQKRRSNSIGGLIICSLIICLIICVVCSPLTQRICYNCCICLDKCFLYVDDCFYKIKNIFRNNSVSENYSNRNNLEINIDIEKCIENKNFDRFFTKIENENENNVICSICIEPLKENVISLNCKHKYHEDCIKSWLNEDNSCPLCRNKIY